MKIFKIFLTLFLAIFLVIFCAKPVWAFCGFYVGKADSKLYNQASQVVLAREGDRTILTMANDYQGDAKDFALVVPVPVVLKEDQVRLGNPKIIERLDSFSAPRLVEYFDPNPCMLYKLEELSLDRVNAPSAAENRSTRQRNEALGVTVENQFSVGEYDILILSAKESNGLETWLINNGYKIPKGASQLLQPYIRQNMKFFVAKVNLETFNKSAYNSLRPLMIAYESNKFMLPIRLGMINGKGEQDLIVYLLSPKGEIELTNYRTVKVPSDVEVPEFVQNKFESFYQAMFSKSYQKEAEKVAFLEYAWDMGGCDPCSAEPLNQQELREAGVFWDSSTFISRIHVRYSRDQFPQDLSFQETSNRQLFQGRYVIRHPYRESMDCDARENYQRALRDRQEKEAQTLAQLTGWNVNDIRAQINFVEVTPVPWWRKLWP